MSGTWLLGRAEHLNGVRAVTTRVRPSKPAFVVPDDDPELAVRAIQSCCSAWGGYGYVMIPCSRTDGLSDDWKAVLGATDPDAVIDCAILTDADKRELEARDWFVHDWMDPDKTLAVNPGALQRSALAAFGEGFEPPESKIFAVVPELAEEDPLYLPLVARWGALDEPALRRAIRRHRYEYKDFPVDFSEFVRLEGVDFSDHPGDLLLGRVPEGVVELGDQGQKLTDMTLIGLANTGVAWSGGGTPEKPEVEEGYADFLVLTGESGSVPDMALYWNLRGERLGAAPFPLWVPLDMLDSKWGQELVAEAVGMTHPDIRREAPKRDQLYILSASADRADLEGRLRTRFPEAVIRTDRLRDFFTGRWKHYLVEEQSPVHFENGAARMLRPRPEKLQKFMPLFDRVVYEVTIDGVRFPQSKAVCDAIYGHAPNRITKDGAFVHLSDATYRAPRERMSNLQLPDGWTMLSSIFEERGYDCVPTQKSDMALGQLFLLGGVENLAVLASSKVQALLKEISRRRGSGRDFVAERQTAAIGRFDTAWGRQPGRDLLRWFVERRVVLRGTELTCPKCRLKKWYGVDRIAEVWRCDGCLEDLPIPLDLHSTPWRYRINELIAAGYDQGTIAPLIAIYLMHTSWGSSIDRSGFGFYPGVEVRVKSGARVPVDHAEIDLVAMRQGKLILVECKESGEPLNDPEEAIKFADQLSGLVELADHLDASRVVLMTTTSFPEAKAPLLDRVPESHAAEIQWWEGTDVLDPYPSERPRRQEGWDKKYLDIARHVVSPPT